MGMSWSIALPYPAPLSAYFWDWVAPDSVLVFEEQVIRQKLDVAGGVLKFVPFALLAWAEIPESICPAAGVGMSARSAAKSPLSGIRTRVYRS